MLQELFNVHSNHSNIIQLVSYAHSVWCKNHRTSKLPYQFEGLKMWTTKCRLH
jgi:hypothetical protein